MGVVVSDEPRFTASPGYAFGQLQRALEKAVSEEDSPARERAEAKVVAWRAVLDGMHTGQLTVGSRTPVADTPAWVTLEVAHGGFATGRYLAEAPLGDDDVARLRALPQNAPGETNRERLNLFSLSDTGQAELCAALASGSYRIDVPEDAAMMVVAWLLDRGHHAAALDLVVRLRPLMHRLRMTPRLAKAITPSAATVRLAPVGEIKTALRSATVNSKIATMLETLRIWLPLYDRLVALWCDTVDEDLPNLSDTGTVEGGWPCRVWPSDWTQRRGQWLADYRRAREQHTLASGHTHPKSNFDRLHRALEACTHDSRTLSSREVGWIRRALANTVSRHGAPGLEERAALRSAQAVVAARPTHASLAAVLAARLDRYPEDGGIPAIEPLAGETTADELPEATGGHPIPPHLLAKATRALEAPVDELVACGVITSGEVLAQVLPQITAHVLAANVDDEQLAGLYAQTYGAFRRRRSLLLLNLEHQIRFDELPWIGALRSFHSPRPDTARTARRTLEQTTMLTLSAFPQAILPNPLVRELGALARQADLPMPLVEEVAADIFMGTFTDKWRAAAEITSRTMAGTLYARYYDLPDAAAWVAPSEQRARRIGRWEKRTAEDFATACAARAKEAQTGRANSYVASNGTVLEQSQILTTHNLALLVEALHLQDRLRDQGPDLVDRTFTWIVARQAMRISNHRARLQMIKNVAYAWRQAIFYLSFCDQRQQHAAVNRLRQQVADAGLSDRFGPAVAGLAHVINGGYFDKTGTVRGSRGRRFLGWTTGTHWCLPLNA
ncbi:hypothetical protein [Nonomuraea sediminis]|uniref:hypothetical protein n=1 Tax=Nonomuraea sediminis TaxID=2835864 RepID=UPI001BDD4FA8|nr:hypothetical protein [Nonomuraea sediminis]